MRVAYLESPAAGIVVNLIRSWKRGEIEQVMSSSSGPKDYVKNRIWQIFDDDPAIARVLMVRGQYSKSAPFLVLVDASGKAFDMTNREVKVER
jgi:hypothetical protein